MIARDQNAACLVVAKEAEAKPAWADYAAYCRLREQGLRKQAFGHLSSFIAQARSWEFETQKEFVLWLCSKMDAVKDADYGPYPTPLRNQLFAPFFEEWLEREPRNDDAHAVKARYLGDHKSYEDAIAINPSNQRARHALACDCLYDLWYATHHLPDYFIGDEQQVKQIAGAAHGHITRLEDAKRRELLSKELADEEQLLDDWIAFKGEGAEDFDGWCGRKGRKYSWVKAYYYDAK